jgi:hypothetical protein
MRAKLARRAAVRRESKLSDGVWTPSGPKKSAGAVQSKFSPSNQNGIVEN